MKVISDRFGYINQIVKTILENKPYPIDEINEIGTRKSEKTTSGEVGTASFLFAAFKGNTDIEIHGVRHSVSDATELFNDILKEFEAYGSFLDQCDINRTNRTIKFKGSVVRIHGLHTQTKQGRITDIKVGLMKGNTKYGMVINEEAHQISFNERQAFMEAVRGYEYMLEVAISNPGSVYNEFINYCNQHQPFNEKALNEDKCDQFGKYEILNRKVVFHYSSWRKNKYIQEGERNKLLNLLYLDPIRARVSVNGMPGLESGAIYSPYMRNIYFEKRDGLTNYDNQYIGGIDWGVVNDSAVVQLGTYDPEYRNGIYGLERAAHNNNPKAANDYTGEYKNNIQLEDGVIENIIEGSKKYEDMRRKGLTVGVELAELAVIDHLNAKVANMGILGLTFTPAPKPPIKKRVDNFTGAMAMGMIGGDKDKFKVLTMELESSTGEEPEVNSMRNKEAKRKDLNDHDINTMEYATYEIVYNLVDRFKEDLAVKQH